MEEIVSRFLCFDPQENINLHGHTGPVWSVKPLSDDSILFSGGEDNKILIWDLQIEEVVGRLSGHSNTVNALELCNDEEVLVSGGWDSLIKIWDWRSQIEVGQLVGHTAGVYVFAVTKNSRILVSGSGDYSARVWDVENRSCLATLLNQSNSIFALALMPDEKTLFTGGWGGVLKEWNFTSYEEISSTQGQNEVIQCMAVTPNSAFLIYGTRTNKVRVQKLPEKSEHMCFDNHNNWVRNLAVTQDSLYFISASADKTIRMVNINEKKEEFCFTRNDGYIFALCFGKNGKRLYSGASDKIVRVRNIGRVRDVKTFKGHTRCVMSVSIASNNLFMVTGSEDTSVKKWSLVDFTQEWTTNFHSNTVWAVNVVESCDKILSAGGDHKLIIMAPDGTLIERLSGHSHPIFCVSSSMCTAYAATGGQDKNVILWNLDERSSEKVLEGHTDTVFSVRFIENDSKLLSGSADYTIRVWCLKNLLILTTVRSQGGMIESVALSTDQNLMIVGDRKNLVNVWNWNDLVQVKTLTLHKKWVKCVAFSHDSKFFASCSNDYTVRVWSSSELYLEFSIFAHQSTIRSVSFSNNGKFLVTVSEDCSAKLWPLDLDDDLGLVDFVGSYEDFLFKNNLVAGVLPNKDHLKLVFSKMKINVLHYYGFVGNHELLAVALKNEVLIKKDSNGKTPLFYSLQRNHWKCVDTFLEHILENFYSKKLGIMECYQYLADDFPLLIRFSNHTIALLIHELMPVSDQSNSSLLSHSNLKLPAVCASQSKSLTRKDFQLKGNKKKNRPVFIRTSTIQVAVDSDESLQILEGICQNHNKDILNSDFIQAFYLLKCWKNFWVFKVELFFVLLFGAFSVFQPDLYITAVVFAGFYIKNFYQTKFLMLWMLAWFWLLSYDLSLSFLLPVIVICLINHLAMSVRYKILACCIVRVIKHVTWLTIICKIVEYSVIQKYQEAILEGFLYFNRFYYCLAGFAFGMFSFLSLLAFEMLSVTSDTSLSQKYWVRSFHIAIKGIIILEKYYKDGKSDKSKHFIHLCSRDLETNSNYSGEQDFFNWKNAKLGAANR